MELERSPGFTGKTVHELNLAQIAMVAGLPKAPSANNPVTDPARAIERRNYVLGQMKRLSYLRRTIRKAIQNPLPRVFTLLMLRLRRPM